MNILTKSSETEASHLLGEWARLTARLYSTAKFEVEPRSSIVSCAVLLPNKEELRVQAANVEAAAIQLTTALQVRIMNARCHCNWAPEWQALLDTTNFSQQREAQMEVRGKADGKDRSKARQETIGVTTKKSLYELLCEIASSENTSVAMTARSLVNEGFNELENRMFEENPRHLLDEFERQLDNQDGSETIQWMLRMSRYDSLKLKFMAKEYGRSVSKLAAVCLKEALQGRVLSGYEVSVKDVEAARAAIQRMRGAAARGLAEQLGFTKSGSPLISGVLSGRINAPIKVYEMLSNVFGVPVRAIKRVTTESFQISAVPSFKAGNDKPTVSVTPEEWDVAVKSLNLSTSDTDRLLHIDE